MKCVNEAFPRPCDWRCSFTIRRFSSRTLTGIERTLVAVGTGRLGSMFWTIFFAGPTMGLAFASGGTVAAGFAAGHLVLFGARSSGCVAVGTLPLVAKRAPADCG